jgi:ligand-binding sensor domain-containing protein
MNRILLACWCVFLSGLYACEKEDTITPPQKDVWTTFRGQGLGDVSVYSIIQDREGTIWAGTYGNGIYKYSNSAWTNLTTSNSPILDDYILCLKEDPAGNIWIGSFDGITKFDGNAWSSVYTSAPVLCAEYYHADHGMYFGLYGGGFLDYIDNQFESWIFNDTSMNRINTLCADSRGYLWFGTKNGIKRMDSDYSLSTFRVRDGLINNFIQNIYEDSRGRLWIGTQGGTVMQWFENDEFHDAPFMNGFDENYIYAISEDLFGNLWFGAISSGVLKYNGSIMEIISPADGLCGNSIISILRDRDNRLWFGGLEGGISCLEQAIQNN